MNEFHGSGHIIGVAMEDSVIGNDGYYHTTIQLTMPPTLDEIESLKDELTRMTSERNRWRRYAFMGLMGALHLALALAALMLRLIQLHNEGVL